MEGGGLLCKIGKPGGRGGGAGLFIGHHAVVLRAQGLGGVERVAAGALDILHITGVFIVLNPVLIFGVDHIRHHRHADLIILGAGDDLAAGENALRAENAEGCEKNEQHQHRHDNQRADPGGHGCLFLFGLRAGRGQHAFCAFVLSSVAFSHFQNPPLFTEIKTWIRLFYRSNVLSF